MGEEGGGRGGGIVGRWTRARQARRVEGVDVDREIKTETGRERHTHTKEGTTK